MYLSGSRMPTLRTALVVLACLGAVALWPRTPSAVPPTSSVTELTGNATAFEGLGSPVGGCGLPQEELDSPDFVALNVYNTPGDYGAYPKPLPPLLGDKAGQWDNGRNCGRFVQVTLGDRCSGTNDGAQGKPFCRNGFWSGDDVSGATLVMVVADGCVDADAWCRDDPGHLGLSAASLGKFAKDGVPAGDPGPVHNRRVSWSFVPAPNYRGDLRIGFDQGAHRFWPAITVSHLPNGVHGVEYLSPGGIWRRAEPRGDMGQSFVIGATAAVGTGYQIRVRDASDALVNNGRVYAFSLPASCAPKCEAVHTQVDYTTDGSALPTSSTPTTTAEPTMTAVKVAPPTTTTTTTTTTTKAPTIACTATAVITSSWPNGYQLDVTVTNTGSSPLTGWSTSFSFPGGQRIGNAWNALMSQASRQVVAGNQSYNGTLAVGASTSWGAIVSGVGQPPSGLSCTVRR
jgi:hypothetical protein